MRAMRMTKRCASVSVRPSVRLCVRDNGRKTQQQQQQQQHHPFLTSIEEIRSAALPPEVTPAYMKVGE
jgi:transcription initiation factor TFIID subunit TAF12